MKNGFDPIRVESVLNSLELDELVLSESIGQDISDGITCTWVHGVDPIHMIENSTNIGRLRSRIKDNHRYLESILEKYLFKNSTRVLLFMIPVKGFIESQEKEQQLLLDFECKNMTHIEIDLIKKKAKELKSRAMKQKPLHLLPKLSLYDLPNMFLKIDSVISENIQMIPGLF